MSLDSAIAIVNQSPPDATTIDLGVEKLTCDNLDALIPTITTKLKHLETLDLRYNYLSALPKSIS